MAGLRTATVVAAAFSLVACQSWTASESEMLTGPDWVLRDISGMRPLHGSQLTLSLSPEGQVSGSGGCNRFVGRWSQRGGQLTLSGLGATMMACEETVMAQEQAYLKSLEGTSLAVVTPGQLTLQTHDGRVFTFAQQ